MPPTNIWLGLVLLSSILFTVALKRSSCARSAFKTVQTTLYRSLSSNAETASISEGTTTGIIIYPYFFPADLRITRPTDCTTSTCEFLAERNITASNEGTSTPSLKQRTLVKILHSFASVSAFNQPNNSSRSGAPIVPSICLLATDTIFSFLSAGNELI